MEISAKKIWFEDEKIFALLNTGNVANMPLTWFPRLLNASHLQRESYEFWSNGEWIHWEELDEDISAEGFLKFKK